MFYNTYRNTKSTMHSAEKNKLAGVGQNIINHRERLLNLQKRQKLKDLLITKFMQKYGINNPEEILEDEITKFLQGEKLNDMDLKRLDQKVKNILKEKASKERLKNSLTQSLQENTLNQPANLNTQTQKSPESKLINSQPRIVTTEPSANTQDQPKLSSSHYNPYNTYCNKRSRITYKNPEEELAELEAEFAKEEELKNKNYERLDFTAEGDEWSAMAKYNRKLYEEQIQEEKLKNLNQKMLNKRELDLQIKQRLKREYEDELKEKEYDRIIEEHQKKMDELDRQKQEEIKKQIMREKESRDEQMRQNYIKKRIEYLKEKKFEKSLVKTIQEGIEKVKKETLEKKRRENEALNNAIKENELKIKRKKEQEKKEKEEDVKLGEERIKMQMKQDQIRDKYYELIRNYGNKYSTKQAEEILAKMKKDQEEEDKKIQFYYDEKNRLAMEREMNEKIRRNQEKKELKKYLDMQIEERKKEEEFLKSLDDEQARIWAIDCKKYFEDERAIESKIRAMNKRNLELVMDQINNKKKKKKNAMSDTEYAMNRDMLQRAKASLSQEKK